MDLKGLFVSLLINIVPSSLRPARWNSHQYASIAQRLEGRRKEIISGWYDTNFCPQRLNQFCIEGVGDISPTKLSRHF